MYLFRHSFFYQHLINPIYLCASYIFLNSSLFYTATAQMFTSNAENRVQIQACRKKDFTTKAQISDNSFYRMPHNSSCKQKSKKKENLQCANSNETRKIVIKMWLRSDVMCAISKTKQQKEQQRSTKKTK